MLLQFKRMMQTAPQYFYHCLEDQFGLKVVDVLNFSRALEALQWQSLQDNWSQNIAKWMLLLHSSFVVHCNAKISRYIALCNRCSILRIVYYMSLPPSRRIKDIFFTSPQYCNQHVFLCVRLHISKTMCPNFTKFSVYVTCGHGSVLLLQHCNTLYTSHWVDNVMFRWWSEWAWIKYDSYISWSSPGGGTGGKVAAYDCRLVSNYR